MYTEQIRWYSRSMCRRTDLRITTSTALMLRLLARPEGAGCLMASVPLGLAELAHRVSREPEWGDRLGLRGDRITFVVSPEVWPCLEDVRSVPEAALRQDRGLLQEVLARLGASGWALNPLLREEFGYLVHCIGEGNWQRGIAYVPEDV